MSAPKRLFDIPYHQLKNYPQEDMFVTKVEGEWIPLSTSDFLKKAMEVSKGLIRLGIQPKDCIAVSSANRFEWNVLDIAVQQVGAILVPLYPTLSAKDYEFILNDCKAKVMVVGNAEIGEKITAVKNNVPSLMHVFSFDAMEGFTNWNAFFDNNEGISESQVEERMAQIEENDLATIIYTSGTTGNPKGVMLSHKNIVSNSMACIEPIPADNSSRVLTFLPICHIYERMLHYLYMYLGCSIYFAESMDTIGDNIREVKPQVFSAVPRLIEKVFDKIMAKGEDLSGIKRKLFFWAVSLAEQYNDEGNSAWYNFRLKIARKLIFSKWQEALGGELNAIASGSAALQPRLARIFLAAGIPILEGYGLTETSPVVSVNCFKKGIRFGLVGALIEGVEVKIAADGEIFVKGPNVMQGYYNNPEATKEVISEDGWFHTGDIGEFRGKYLKITDRKKEIFKTSGGKHIVPQALENALKESRFIEQVMVIGENKNFPAALIVPNFAFVKDWALRHEKDYSSFRNEEIILEKLLKERIQKELDGINSHFGNWEQIKQFRLLPFEFSIEGNELTPTLKLKRKNILSKYASEVDDIYR